MKNPFRNAGAFVCSVVAVGLGIGEGVSLRTARECSAQAAVTVAVQTAINNNDCSLVSVRGHTFRYSSAKDTLGVRTTTGTVTVGKEFFGIDTDKSGGLVYRLDLKDNVSGRVSDSAIPTNLSENDRPPFGRITVTSAACATENLAIQ